MADTTDLIEKEVERVVWRFEQMLGSVDKLSNTGGNPRDILKMIVRESIQDANLKLQKAVDAVQNDDTGDWDYIQFAVKKELD